MAVNVGRVGIWTGSPVWRGAEGREALAELDDLGYGALWLGRGDGIWDLLGDLLGASRRIPVATGIASVWLESPEDMAAHTAALTAAHPGRFLLGIGASHGPIVEAVTDQAYTKPYSKVVEFLDGLDAAATPVPVDERVIAALGPRTIRLSGERALGAHPYLTTPEHTREAREILGDGPLLAPEQKVVLDTDPVRARALGRAKVAGTYLRLPNYVNNLRRLGFPDAEIEAASDDVVDALIAWGSPDDIAERIRAHHDAGADHVAVQVLTEDDRLARAEWRELAKVLV
ncbi:MAG TPA: LLM class F420-dependent oxidoreductase [Streptosporangiaceae bacterium]|jgi:probable F420-dependent oxidoreductase